MYVEFPLSNINDITLDSNIKENGCQLIPGNICFGVYVALKMFQLKFDFKIPLMK